MAELPTHTVEFDSYKITIAPETGLSKVISIKVKVALCNALYPELPVAEIPDHLFATIHWYGEVFSRQVEVIGLPIPPKTSSIDAIVQGYRDLFMSVEYVDAVNLIHDALVDPHPEELDEKKETS